MSGMKKHGFWILLGVILLAEVAFLWFAVIGRGKVIEARQGDLETVKIFLDGQLKRDQVPSPELRDQYEKIKKSYGDHEKALVDYYISRDQAFEPRNLGPLAEYRVAYTDAMDQLEAEFREKTGAPELEGGKRRFRLDQGFAEADMVGVEKRLRIQKELADVLIRCGVKDLVQVRFVAEKKEKKEKKTSKKKGEEEGPLIEYDTHDLTADIVCDFETIPVILATIHQSQNIPFRLRRMLMRKAIVMGEQELKDESMSFEDGNTVHKEFQPSEKDAYENLPDDDVFPEPPVELVLSLEVVDIRERPED